AVAGLADNLQISVQLQQRLEALAQQALVVYQENAYSLSLWERARERVHPTGTVTARRLPAAPALPKPSCPPTSSTRSRSPTMPNPAPLLPGPTPSSSTASSTCPLSRRSMTWAARA